MAGRRAWGAVLMVSAMLAGIGGGAGAAGSKVPNPANDELLKLDPPQRAERLARAFSRWCIGTEAFLMGVVTDGSGAGNAYWSLRCADGSTWAVQVDPLAQVSAIDCESFKAAALGKECFKKF